MKILSEFVLEKLNVGKRKDKSDPEDPTTWIPGDILYVSWGYDMTIIDFYEVIANNGKTLQVRELKSRNSGGQYGKTEPQVNTYANDKIWKCRINAVHKYVKCDGHFLRYWCGESMHYNYMD